MSWKIGDRVRILGDRPSGGREGVIIGGHLEALIRLDKRYKTRRVYDYSSKEFEIIKEPVKNT